MSARPIPALICLLLALLVPPSALALSGGRAYEQVTPTGKNGGDVGGPAFRGSYRSARAQASSDGNSITYVSLQSFGDAQGGEMIVQYTSSRRADGWVTHSISPPGSSTRGVMSESSPFRFFAPDLSAGLLEWPDPVLDDVAPPGFENIYVHRADGAYQALIAVPPPNQIQEFFEVTVAGASSDLEHVVFEANDALTTGAPPSARSVYEWTGAGLRLVSVLPSGAAAASAAAGNGRGDDFTNVVASDGSRIFWTDAAGQLYAREGGTQTVKLNASRRTVSSGDGSATLRAISAGGSRAIFTDTTPLTDAAGDNGGLYLYDLGAGSLTNLTPSAGGSPGVQGVLGASEDGSVVYYVAGAVLAPGGSAGAMNLYVARGGTSEHVAVLGGADSANWTTNAESRSARLTPDGRHLAFISRESLTGYDNTDPLSGERHPELFVYDAAAGDLTCVSCNPSGARPIGGASLPPGVNLSHQPRVISDDGSRVVFNSQDALAPADGNRRQDVYEYTGGRPQLVSTGTSNDASALADVSPDGRDVFFTTRTQLVPTDRDNGSDLYDARLGGGFPVAGESLPCAGEACRGPLSVPPAIAFPVATSRASGQGSKGRRARCRGRSAKTKRTTRPKRCRRRR